MRVLFFLLLFISSTALAQDVKLTFKHLDIENGLSSRSVTSCIQDTNGYIWFGSQNGLNKFDGSQFKIYTHLKNDSLSISNDNINKIYRLKNGEIWVSTGTGLSKYDALYDRFINIQSGQNQNGELSSTLVSAMIEMPDNNTYVLAYDGINLMDKNNLSFKHYPAMVDNDQILHFTCAVPYNPEQILLGTHNDGLFIFDTETKTYIKFYNLYPELKYIPQSVTALLLVKNEIWIGTLKGLFAFNLKSNLLTPYTNNPELYLSVRTWVNTIYLDNDSNVWVGTMADGLLRYSYDCDCFTTYREDANNPNSISRNAISSIYQDTQGILWVGTYEGGVNYSHPLFDNFSTVSHQVGNNNSLISNQVTCFLEDSEGDLWIGTENGMSLRKDENEFTNLSAENSRLRHNKIQSLCEVNPGEVLIGHRTGIDIINKKSTTIKSFHFDDLPNLANQWVSKISLLSKNKIVVLFASGQLVFYDMKEKQTIVIHDNQDGVNARDFVLNLEKGLWFLLKKGIVYYNLDTKTKRLIWKNPTEDNISILAINNELTNICVAVTNNLHVYNIESQKTKVFINNECQLCQIRSMEYDSKGHLWLGTTNGLLFLNPENESWSYYTKQDGLSSNMSNKSIFHKKNGNIYLSSNNGYTFFNPHGILKNTNPPQVRISDVYLFNRRLKPGDYEGMPKEVNSHKKLIFNYNHSFTLNFSVLNNLYPHKNKVFVFLEGHDKDWVQLEQDYNISYTKLEPKDYNLYYKALNNDGYWSRTHKLFLNINPPFWKQLWFRPLLIVLIVSLIVVVIRIRLYIIKREKRLLEDKVKKRNEDIALSNQQKFAYQIEIQAYQHASTDIDKLFFKKAVDIIHENIDKDDFTISSFVKLMGGSRSSVYDKIRAITNMSVNEFIKTIRLKKAALLIRESNLTISEIAYRVGFKDTSHFTKVFKKQYGKSPTEYSRDFSSN